MFNIKFVRELAGIKEYELDNGLKVLLLIDASKASLTVNITYLVGSRHEGLGEAGMAHLLEHMLFKSTKNCSDIKAALLDKGATFNGTTWFDRTNYYSTITPSMENLEFLLQLEADRMINSNIFASELASEMTVVRNEFEMGENEPTHVLFDQMMSASYMWHNYGKSTIGNRSDIEKVPAWALKKFYENYYQPDNAVLIIAGQFEESKALELVKTHFSQLKKPSRIISETYTLEPAQNGPKEVLLERNGDVSSIGALYHIVSGAHPDHASIKVLMDCLTDEPGGFLYEKLILSEKCSEVTSVVYSLHDPSIAMFFVRPNKIEEALVIKEELLDLIENKASLFIDEISVERIKKRYLKRFKLSAANSKDMAIKLSESIATKDWRLYFWYKEQIEKVTLNDVKRVLNKYFIRSNRTLGVFLPKKDVSKIEIDNNFPILEELEVLKDKDKIVEGEEFIAKAENIEKMVIRKKFNSNNKVAILRKKTRGEALRAKLIFRFSQEENFKTFLNEWSIIPAIIWRGCAKYNYQGIRDRLDFLMSTLDFDSQLGTFWAATTSDRTNIEDVFKLLNDMLNEPSFDKKEYNIVRNREILDYEEMKNDPERVSFQELARLKYPTTKENIHYVPTFEEKISALRELSLAKVKEAFGIFSMNNWQLSVVGEIDPEIIYVSFPKVFNWLSAHNNYERIKKPFLKNILEKKIIDTKDKEMAIITYAFNFPMRDDDKDYASLKMLNYIFGENMNSRLMKRIREKEGISYGAQSWVEISRFEENASFNMYAMAAPQNVTKAKIAMEEEWMRFLHDGVSIEELSLAKESMLASFNNTLSSDGSLMNMLLYDLEIDRDFYWRKNLFDRIGELSINELKDAAQKWWSKEEFSEVVAGDRDKFK